MVAGIVGAEHPDRSEMAASTAYCWADDESPKPRRRTHWGVGSLFVSARSGAAIIVGREPKQHCGRAAIPLRGRRIVSSNGRSVRVVSSDGRSVSEVSPGTEESGANEKEYLNEHVGLEWLREVGREGVLYGGKTAHL